MGQASCPLLYSNHTPLFAMSALTVKSNYAPRECTMGMYLPGFGALNPGSLYGKLRAEFDHLTENEFDQAEFFNYRGVWYCVGDFMRIDANSTFDANRWDGYSSDTYFSGVLMKYQYDGTVIVGRYSS